MIAIPSPSFQEERVSTAVSLFLQSKGIAHTRLYNNILAVNKGYSPEKKTLLLCAHLDTISPVEGYDFDPYTPDDREVKSVLYDEKEAAEEVVAGLGANDDGASVVALIAAFRYFYEGSLPMNLLLVLSSEEERSGQKGMAAVWEALERGALSFPIDGANGATTTIPIPDYAIVGEPTGMRVATAERGLLVLDAVAQGVSGHAAREEGVNAIYIALHDITTLLHWHFDRRSPQMGEVRLAVTQIQAGTAHNVVPDTCTFVIDIRPTEQYTNAEIVQMLQAVCRSTLTARNLLNHASATAEASPLLATAQQLGIPTFVSPTTSDWMRLRCDAIKMGPGCSSRSHRKNEYITVAALCDGIDKYITFINTFLEKTDYGNTMG